jgi:hypothetical protein
LVQDIGFVASNDPVAIDKASLDLISKANGGTDPFKAYYPKLNPALQIEYAEELGLGTSDYNLVEI